MTNPDPLATRGLATVTSLDGPRPEPTASATRATYTVREVAKMLGLSRASVYAQLQAGEIPARRIGSRWIIAKHRFNTWLNSGPEDDLRPTGTEAGR